MRHLSRKVVLVVAALAVMGMRAAAQAPAQKPSFEVTSVRPCQPSEPGGGLQPAPGGQRYVAKCVSLKAVIWVSYWLQPDQIVGGPDWVEKDLFYIEGVAARPSSIAELHVMMQNALVERFNLRLHRETKEREAYVLVLDKNGAKNLSEHAPTNARDLAITPKGEGLHEEWTATSSPMDFFVWRLALKLGRPVIDQTGLRAAGYDFNLSFTNEPPPKSGTDPDPAFLDSSGPTIFQALRNQLGLRLDSRKAPVDALVIDSVQKPSEN